MQKVEVMKKNTWRTEFMCAERHFFRIASSDWRASLDRSIKDLGINYTNDIHKVHVKWLNGSLKMNPPLTVNDFSGDMTLGELRENVIAKIITTSFDLALPEGIKSLSHIGLSHLRKERY